MTTETDASTSANPQRKLTLIALLFGLAAVGTIFAYKSRSPEAVAATVSDTAGKAVAAEGGASASSTPAIKTAFSDTQKGDIEKIIREYLVKNPELMLEVQSALDAKLQARADEKAKTAVSENAATLYKRADAPSAGKADGDITVVEFFDYNCGYCKRGLGDITKLIDNDKNVRVVFKELPILSKGSEEAARVALAAGMQNKYWDVHRALLSHRGQANKESALKIAEKAGLDMAKLKIDMDGDTVTNEIKLVRTLADKMGINGTPHFLVGDKSIPGAPEDLFEQLTGHIADIRKNGCDVC